jgi:tRNA-dihydrouridine synthase A
MVTTGALLHGDRERFLAFDPVEHPLALQLGGSDPAALAACARLAEAWGFDEVNLNCGCPSDRVQNNMIGACLMAHAPLVADCLKAMQDACSLPVTVKHRIGIDEQDSYDEMRDFVGTLAEAGCQVFIVHARKAWLQGLSPKENREIPPLRYEEVYRLKRELPHLTIVVNGGIPDLAACDGHLSQVDGVMLGRSAYHNPWLLAEADSRLFGEGSPATSREAVIEGMIPYIERHLAAGGSLHHISRHLLGLYHNRPGARGFRRLLSSDGARRGAGIDVLRSAVAAVADRHPATAV